jgi:hypothetical protein
VLLCTLGKNGQFYPHKKPYSNSNISLLQVTRPRLQVILFSARNYHLVPDQLPMLIRHSGALRRIPISSLGPLFIKERFNGLDLSKHSSIDRKEI